jgi:hypothetical protein
MLLRYRSGDCRRHAVTGGGSGGLISSTHRPTFLSGSNQKERPMIICDPRSLAFALLIAALPVGFALAAGSGGRGGAIGAGVGAAGMGSAAVGGGAPAGAVGGGPPAGAVGGGSPGSNNPAGNGAAGTGNPSRNAVGVSGNPTNASPGTTNATTNGGVIGGGLGVPPPPKPTGGISPSALAKQPASDQGLTVPNEVQGVAEEAPLPPTGLSRPGPDGVSTTIVAARPCGVAAHETDGTTTCIGIPGPVRRGDSRR